MLRPVVLALLGVLAMPTHGASEATASRSPVVVVVDEVPPVRGGLPPEPTAESAPSPASLGGARPSTDAVLACIREIESSGDYGAVSRDGRYHGAYQFGPSTWRGAVARAGFGEWAVTHPSQAPAEVQDAAAAQLLSERGLQPWPTPARRC